MARQIGVELSGVPIPHDPEGSETGQVEVWVMEDGKIFLEGADTNHFSAREMLKIATAMLRASRRLEEFRETGPRSNSLIFAQARAEQEERRSAKRAVQAPEPGPRCPTCLQPTGRLQ